MITSEVKQFIKRELPILFREDVEIHQFILELTRSQFADKCETESRFDRIMSELRRNREEDRRKWDEQEKKWAEQQRQSDEQNKRWNEHWNEHKKQSDEENARWKEQNEHWKEQNERWNEQEKKWQQNQQHLDAMLQEIRHIARKHESSIGALGARWGIFTEQSFRSALQSILEESFGMQVLNINEFDERGEVFGHPDQVELDIIIQNGLLIICEIKSSMSRSDVYTFERKVKFYERLHATHATRKIVITPMIQEDARSTASRLGLEVFTHAEDVTPL